MSSQKEGMRLPKEWVGYHKDDVFGKTIRRRLDYD